MGQAQITQLLHYSQKLIIQSKDLPQTQPITSQQFLSQIIKQHNLISNSQMTAPQLQSHLSSYLQSQLNPPLNSSKRRRSYQLLHQQSKTIEETSIIKDSKSTQLIKIVNQKIEWLEDIEELIRNNITQLMTTQKSHKIRQNFRKLILSILHLDNLHICLTSEQGPTQLHSFKQNQVIQIINHQTINSLNSIITDTSNTEDNLKTLLNLLEINPLIENIKEYHQISHNKTNIIFMVSEQEGQRPIKITEKTLLKIYKIAIISTYQQQITIIQHYSKELLQILENLILESEPQTSQELGYGPVSIDQLQKIMHNDKNEALLLVLATYQQVHYQMLQRIRMYKKYVCQGDKIFMQFNQTAQLTFLSNNFQHPSLKNLSLLHLKKQLFIEHIFPDYKPINEFVKKALQNKLKNNKIYQLDFEIKARVIYDQTKDIEALHIIIEETDSSSNSSAIFNSSSTKILSEGSDYPSIKDLEKEDVVRERRPSTLAKTLQKDHPGITKEGWINLFIKDDSLVRRAHGKGKRGRTFTARRSYSLNRSIENICEDQTDKPLHSLNTDSIDLNLLTLEDEHLEPFVFKVFRRLQYFHSDHIDRQSFSNFLCEIHQAYQVHNNPFHNFTHGVNVMHTCFLLTQATRIQQQLTPRQIFTIIFSGLCHDVGHTGFTNLFQIASQSKKAITYNDISPLQNYHAATTFEILRKPQNYFLKNLSRQQIKQFREAVVKNILFTDIKEHFPLLTKFNKIIQNQSPPNNQEYVSLLSCMIVHTADFGGSAKQFDICKEWSLKVNLQFSNQYRRQGELGLPQTPFMKDLTNLSILSKNEGGFLKVIVLPLYQTMDQFCENDARIHRLRQYIENNLQRWQQIHRQTQFTPKQGQSSQKQINP